MDFRIIFVLTASILSAILLYLLTGCVYAYFGIVDSQTFASLTDAEYDYIVVGSGTAGSLLAARLSEIPGKKVLVLEAGPQLSTVERFISDTPLLTLLMIGTSLDWTYTTVPQKSAGLLLREQRMIIPAGRLLGGSQMMNAMIVSRGHPTDYDQWKVPGWDFKHLSQFFKPNKSSCTIEEEMVRLHPLSLEIANAFDASVARLGHQSVPRKNDGWSYEGFYKPLVYVKKGRRASSYSSCLEPALQKGNLSVVHTALVDRVVIRETGHASGVVVHHRGQTFTPKVRRGGEIVLSAGAISTPSILLRSGIGPFKHLREFHELDTILDIPVGENLHDHIMFGLYVSTNGSSITTLNILNPLEIMNYLFFKKGLWAHAAGLTNVGYHRTSLQIRDGLSAPDIQYYVVGVGSVDQDTFKKISNYKDDETWSSFIPANHSNFNSGFIVTTVLLNVKSRGTIRLNSTSPHDPPLINPNYLSHKEDTARLKEGIHFLSELITKSEHFQKLDAKIHFPRYKECMVHGVLSDPYLDCVLHGSALSVYHPGGSCKMAALGHSTGVLGPDLRVKGMKNLRVVDASVFPSIPSGNPCAPIMMIAEKAAHMMRHDCRIDC